MGYRGNYTGYAVNGLDVFLWVLLTAGTLGFSILVLTICFIKKHFKEKLPVDEDIPESKSRLKKMGIMGPYFNSEENVNKNKNSNINESDLDKNGRVRFKEDSLNLNISKPTPIIKNISHPNVYENRNTERAFVPPKLNYELTTNFNPSFLRSGENRKLEQIYSLSDSISDTNNLQLSNKDLSSLDIKEKRESFENLYTQVQPQALRNMSKNSNDTFNNLNNQDFNDAPVYMNTS